MELSNDLISQFAKITKDEVKRESVTTVYGTVKEQNNHKYVQIDGSSTLTPVSTTADIKNNERVIVQIKEHSAIIVGNLTSPSASSEDVRKISGDITDIDEIIDAIYDTIDTKLDINTFDTAIDNINTELDKKVNDGVYQALVGRVTETENSILALNGYIGPGNDNTTLIKGQNISFEIEQTLESSNILLKPYYSKGDVINIEIDTTGFTMNDGKDIHFTIPLTKPIAGNPIITPSSTDGFKLIQNGKYTHGSNSSTYINPSSYTIASTITTSGSIKIVARFTNTTDAVDLSTIGIIWSGKITLS